MSHLSDWTPAERSVIEFAVRRGFAAAEIADALPGRSLSAIGGKMGSVRADLKLPVVRVAKKPVPGTVAADAAAHEIKVAHEYDHSFDPYANGWRASCEHASRQYAAAWAREAALTLEARAA